MGGWENFMSITDFILKALLRYFWRIKNIIKNRSAAAVIFYYIFNSSEVKWTTYLSSNFTQLLALKPTSSKTILLPASSASLFQPPLPAASSSQHHVRGSAVVGPCAPGHRHLLSPWRWHGKNKMSSLQCKLVPFVFIHPWILMNCCFHI